MLAAIVFITLAGCTRKENSDIGFTLETGIRVNAPNNCGSHLEVTPPTITKKSQGYEIALQDYFDCTSDLQKTYLTISRDGKATLVLGARDPKGPFYRACECGQSVRVDLVDRLEPGEKIYIVSDSEVIGEVTVP